MTRGSDRPAVSDPQMVEALRTLLDGHRASLPDLCKHLGVSENWLKELWRGKEGVPPPVAIRAADLLEERAEHLWRMSQRFRRAARPPCHVDRVEADSHAGKNPVRRARAFEHQRQEGPDET